jgi:predicted DNA-binding transcriptional regulator AlpA
MAAKNLSPPVTTELLSASDAARLSGVGKRSWWRYVTAGKAPQPVRIGGAVRWRRAELVSWIAAGCPAVRSGGQPIPIMPEAINI